MCINNTGITKRQLNRYGKNKSSPPLMQPKNDIKRAKQSITIAVIEYIFIVFILETLYVN